MVGAAYFILWCCCKRSQKVQVNQYGVYITNYKIDAAYRRRCTTYLNYINYLYPLLVPVQFEGVIQKVITTDRRQRFQHFIGRTPFGRNEKRSELKSMRPSKSRHHTYYIANMLIVPPLARFLMIFLMVVVQKAWQYFSLCMDVEGTRLQIQCIRYALFNLKRQEIYRHRQYLSKVYII